MVAGKEAELTIRKIRLITRLVPVCLILPAMFGSPARVCAASNVAYTKTTIANIPVNVVTANLNSPDVLVTPALARYGVGSSETFRSMMRRTRPAAAINGTFFCTRTFRPTGDIVIDGQLLWKGCLGTAIGVDYTGSVRFVPSGDRDNYRWSDFDRVLAAGPTLVLGGKTLVNPASQGFKSGVHYTPRARSAVGLTYYNKLVLVTTGKNIYYSDLARVMKNLNCVDAAVLDGGSSIGLYCQGKLIANPGRAMTNCLLVYDNRDSYEKHRNAFYPAHRPQVISHSRP